MIIGITGKKFSGKDICANYLINNHKYSTYKFAGPIKRIMKDVFLMSDAQINGDQKEVIDPRWDITGRQGQQVVGTELFRDRLREVLEAFNAKIGKDIWAMRFKYWYESLPEGTDIVISDVRFLNECDIIRDMGGTIIRIERPSLDSLDTHSSEMEMEMIVPDHTIFNSGTIQELEYTMCVTYKEVLCDV